MVKKAMGSKQQEQMVSVVVVSIILVCAAVIISVWRSVKSDKVDTYWRGDSLAVSTYWDSNRIVVTHLVVTRDHSSATATLPEPRLVMESGGTVFDRKTLNQLVWKGQHGEPFASPAQNTPVSAVYYHPSFSNSR